MSELPISNIINVSITNTPSGLTERNVNSLAIFTNEPTNNIDPYRIYISAAQVAEDFGSNAVTTQMANAIFAQTPNIRTGNGRLVILPMLNSVSATRGQVSTPDISANLNAIKLVTNGDIRVTVDGVNYDLTGLNFTEAVTWADVAAILQAKLINGTVTAEVDGFNIFSKTTGTTSTVALAAVPAGTGTALNGNGYFNAAASTTAAGAAATGETLVQAINRTQAQVGYVGVMTNLNLDDTAFAATATAIQAMDKLFFHHFASTAAVAGAATTNKNAGNTKTRPVLYTLGLAQANLMKAAYAGRALSVNFTGSNTSQTMNLKQLATIVPDPNISQTLYVQANTAGIDLYVSYDGVPSVFSTEGNDFFDNPYSDLALKFALETAGFNFLRQTNTKVPQTEQGMNGLKSAYGNVCERFIRNGCIAPGSWNSSETFGDPAIFRDNILQVGYYVYSLPIILQNQSEREQRKAPLVQIAIKRAGAIHTSDVIVLVQD